MDGGVPWCDTRLDRGLPCYDTEDPTFARNVQTCGLRLHGPGRREERRGDSGPPDLTQSLVHVEAAATPRPAAEGVDAHVHVVASEGNNEMRTHIDGCVNSMLTY